LAALLKAQRPDVIFVFVQFEEVLLGQAPRTYAARPPAIAAHLKTQRHGLGYGSLQEDFRRDGPGSKYDHRIPKEWMFSQKRIDGL
jgi:hypothetical protein